jgi:hypothetical protein
MQFRCPPPGDDSHYRTRFCENLKFNGETTHISFASDLLDLRIAESPATVDNFRNIVDALMQNKAMWIMAAAFAAAAIVVYFIRRVETAHSWTIAIIAGNVVELFVLLFGDMQFDTNIDLAKVFMGVFLSLIIELLVEFFCFMVDYTRIENVQFEDDDYYYYVKAVPKVTVSDSLRIVKTISTSENSGADFREQVSRKVTDGSAESNE